jgi:hypothetical protein
MEENNFQTLNIKHKIKKINKKRRNIQNIEPLETLSNIPDSTVEGMQTIQDSDYEGLDDVISQGLNEESVFARELTNIINRIYISLITFNCLIAFSIANSTRKSRPDTEGCGGDIPYTEEYTDPKTGKKKKRAVIDWEYITSIIEIDYGSVKYGQVVNMSPITGGNENLDPGLVSDANAIYRYVCLFESVISTFLFTFVWFYIIFYSYSNDITNESYFNLLNREHLRTSTNVFVKIALFVFEFAIAVFEDMRWFFEKKFPEYALFFNRPFCFLVLFFLILQLNHKYLSYLKDLLIDILHTNYQNIFVVVLYLVVIYEFIKFWIYGSVSTAKKAESENPVDQAQFLMSIFVKVLPLYLNPFSSIPIAFYKAVKEVLRLVIALAVSVPFGALLCVTYFMYISLVFPFLKIIPDFGKSFVQNIYNFIKSEGEFSNKDPCDIPMTSIEKLGSTMKDMFANLCITIFNVLPYLVFIIFAAYFIRIHLLDEFQCPGTTKFLQGINITILAIGILGLAWHFFNVSKILTEKGNVGLFAFFVVPPMSQTLGLIAGIISITPVLILVSLFIFAVYNIKSLVNKGNAKMKSMKSKVKEKAEKAKNKISDLKN